MAGRVGAGMGASLAEMRATEQIDAIDALSVDLFRLLVVPPGSRGRFSVAVVDNVYGRLWDHQRLPLGALHDPPFFLALRNTSFPRGALVQFCSAYFKDCGFRLHYRQCLVFFLLYHR